MILVIVSPHGMSMIGSHLEFKTKKKLEKYLTFDMQFEQEQIDELYRDGCFTDDYDGAFLYLIRGVGD